MTIDEAIQSGRPFRHKDAKKKNWLTAQVGPSGEWQGITRDDGKIYKISAEDVMSDDFELKPEKAEFECIWREFIDPFSQHIIPTTEFNLRPLVGRRTRLTVEFLD